MADDLAPAPVETSDAPAEEATSLADHAALYGPPDPTLEGEAKAKNEEARAQVRHRARSQQAGAVDAPRIQELTKKLRAAEAERDALKAPAAPVPPARADLAPPRADPRGDPGVSRPAAPQLDPQTGLPVDWTPTRPRPTLDEIGSKYESYEDVADARALWLIEQRDAIREAKEQQTFDERIQHALSQRDRERIFKERVDSTHAAGRKAYADFDQILSSGPGAFVALGRTPQIAIERAAFVIAHPQSEHLQYKIMSDRALAERLGQIVDDKTFGLELAKLEPQGNGQSEAAPAPLAVAPRPPNPVRTGTARADEGPSDEMSISEHEKAYGRRWRR